MFKSFVSGLSALALAVMLAGVTAEAQNSQNEVPAFIEKAQADNNEVQAQQEDDTDWGWIGLFGLLGLMGLKKQKQSSQSK